MRSNKKRTKAKAGPIKKRILIIAVAGVLAAVLVFLILFRVTNIIVTGNTRYTDDEIKSFVIDENSFNNTVLFCFMNRTVTTDDVPLLESIDVSYVDRNTIMLKANEKLTIGMFQSGDNFCCIDQDGVVVDVVDATESANLNLPVIYNLCDSGEEGKKIELEDDSVLNTLHAFMSAFEKYGIMPNEIHIEDETLKTDSEKTVKTYTLMFGEIKILTGQDEYLEEKMKRLAAILSQLNSRSITSGTLHLETYDEDTENIIFDTTE